jgi:hypothetical protein
MKGQTRRSRLIGVSADRLAGAIGLLLALALIAVAVVPAYAQGEFPSAPHLFEGTARTLTPAAPVPAGTLVQAFVGAELRSSTQAGANGHYYFEVPGQAGDWVTFQIAGVVANNGTAVKWVSMELSMPFDLTIPALPVVAYSLTMAVAPTGTGNATDMSGASPYAAGVAVAIKAVPAAGYQFVNWMAPAGSFASASAAQTTFTMPAQSVTVTANFAVVTEYTLTVAASPIMGGTVADLTGTSPYQQGEVVTIQAAAATGYQFVRWTAAAGSFANANALATTFTMPGQNAIVTASFQLTQTDTGALCFIATAAYGSPTAEQIDVLRDFRDAVLLPNSLGAGLVSLYYRTSPPIAEFISRHDFLRTAVRVGLSPIVAVLKWSYPLWSEGS